MTNKDRDYVNANFQSLTAASVHDAVGDPDYVAYRRNWNRYPVTREVSPFPLHLDIEATCRCNLRCTFCDKQPLLPKGSVGDMDMAVFRRIVDEGTAHGLCSIKFSFRGEPLLHPQLPEMVAYAMNKGTLDTYFNTNGMLLTEGLSRELIASGLRRISFSVEGVNPEMYEKQRRGARFETVRANIAMLRDLRDRSGSAFPKIRVQTVRLPWVDTEEYARFWGELSDETAALDFTDSLNKVNDLVDRDFCCPQIWQRMTITWDGTILACNNDDYMRSAFGNVHEISLMECWMGDAMTTYREAHAAGLSHEPAHCKDCSWRATQILKRRGVRK